MRTAFRATRWACILVLAAIPIRVSAESMRSAEAIREIMIDFNRDGKSDRAVLTRNDDEGSLVDLTIYLGVDAVNPAGAPSFVKRRLASGHLHEMTAKGNGSLRVESRCGGCSNDDVIVFTIVYRAGQFLVGGFSRSWELRDGSAGSCDVNYLTGKGVASKGLPERNKPIKTVFRPIRLADWSDEKVPKVCRP
jgi:hypothetical protein